MRKKIAILTTSRADYGFLCPLLDRWKREKRISVKLIVCGSHLSRQHGYTIKEILKDKRKIHFKFETIKKTKTRTEKSIEYVLKGFTKALDKIKPNLIFLPADRYEILAAAYVALVKKIPIIHYAGGQITEGAWDNSIRHAVTKLSHIHLVSTINCKKKLIQMGEQPSKVFVTGSLGIDNIKKIKFFSKEKIEKNINFNLKEKPVLVTFHSETLGKNTKNKIQNLIQALKYFKKLNYIFTSPNLDKDNEIIINEINKFTKNNSKSIFIPSLGKDLYLSLMKNSRFVIGNSSSGIIETPSFKIPTVNIGNRQDGRIKCRSIVDCSTSKKAIVKSINRSLNKKFISSIKNVKNPYGDGNASKKITTIINKIKINNLIKKRFYEIKNFK